MQEVTTLTYALNDLYYFLKETYRQVKLDIDGDIPEWEKLRHIFNFLYLFPDAKITRSSSGDGYHLFANVRLCPNTNLRLRMALGDCSGRIMFSERRGGDIIFKRKGIFRVKKAKEKIIFETIRHFTPDEEITLRDVLALPLNPYIVGRKHRRIPKRRIRKWKMR